MKKISLIIIIGLSLGFWFGAEAAVLNETISFNIDSAYDISDRSQVQSILVKETPSFYFYVEKSWWETASFSKQNEIFNNFNSLDQEFQNKIYPVLTSAFGSERRPGIDGDLKITVLFHPLKEGTGGYFRSADGYQKIQIPSSNQREMLYLAIDQIDKSRLRDVLAHEFVHLITFNQKDIINGVSEEVWLNEARAEYASTLLGYDDVYEGSNLQKRVQIFLENPQDSLAEWMNSRHDYGVVNLFTQYLVDHYGVKILSDSLKLKLVGIPSINEALSKNGFNQDFAQIFTDWEITVAVNDCSLNPLYCYLNKNLKSFRLNPTVNFLPLFGSSSLSVTNSTKSWAGNWQKFIGGSGNLKLEFSGLLGANFKVPYLVQSSDGSYLINYLKLDNNQKGEITIDNFGREKNFLIIIPSVQVKTVGFDGSEPAYFFSFTASTFEKSNGNLGPWYGVPANFVFSKNLFQGMYHQDVVYLKIMLAAEGCVSGLANTTYFGPQTLRGVKCLQNKYKAQISQFAGYNISSTGFVGLGTKRQLNVLLGLTQ